jgi:carboxylesterase
MATTSAPEGWLADYASVGTTHSKIGIIFVHGFTGSPASMRPWAHYFHEQGYTVRVPRLPGHGTQWQDLNKVAWQKWPERVAKDLAELRKSCEKVFIFGLSMGGCTTLNVAEYFDVDGIVLVNPMIHIPGLQGKLVPLISKFRTGAPSVGDDIKKPNTTEWGYDVLPIKGVNQLNKMLRITRQELGRIEIPVLLFHSTEDHVLPVSNTEIIMAGISSKDKVRVELGNSYHVATLDNDAQTIFATSLNFVERLS